ncbi:MAG: hydantoinase B/oxoprolinase family protein [Chloroflexi bacterium]|nr:hydantoinase B/oxoprolinase family protein [Chloroflexota bacterium]
MTIDPVRLEVLKNALLAITEEQGAALQRSAYSTNIKTRMDFSCALFDEQLRLLAQAFTQPTHLASLVLAVPRAIREFGVENLEPGDGILTNDPHRGAVHLNDMILVSPIFSEGKIYAYAANIAHHVDVGGTAPGSIAIAREIYQEGIIVPPIRLVRGGEIDEGYFKFIQANIRAVREVGGDFRAQVAANNLAARRTEQLIAKYGADELRRYGEALLDYTERRTRAGFKQIPNGVYEAEGFMDTDALNPERTRLHAKVTVQDGDVVVDLSGCSKQNKSSLNATRTMMYSGIVYVLKCLIESDIPVNDGFHRTLNIVAPEGTVVNCKHPSGVVGGFEIAMRLTDVLFKAFAPALPNRVTAATKGCLMQIAFGAMNYRTNEYISFYETIAGGEGARPAKDGNDGVQCHVQNTENSPIEETEMNYPLRIVRYGLIPDSEGAGRWRGGLGVRRDYIFPDGEARYTILSDRGQEDPWGLFGGHHARHAYYIVDPDGEQRQLRSRDLVTIEAGQVVSIQSPGGGGYGPPRERAPELVLRDVVGGKVSVEKAAREYGVVVVAADGGPLRATGGGGPEASAAVGWEIDVAATAVRRRELAAGGA